MLEECLENRSPTVDDGVKVEMWRSGNWRSGTDDMRGTEFPIAKLSHVLRSTGEQKVEVSGLSHCYRWSCAGFKLEA